MEQAINILKKHTCTHTHTYIHIHTHTQTHIYAYIHTHTNTHTYTHTHTYMVRDEESGMADCTPVGESAHGYKRQ